jgi:hypothetical protein
MWSVSSTLMIVHAVASRRIRSLANRAVERVIDQEKFHHTLATFLGKAQTGARTATLSLISVAQEMAGRGFHAISGRPSDLKLA